MITPETNRRDFLAAAARTAVLSALGGLAALLIVRRQLCTNRGVCKSCTVYAKCELPQREKRR